MKCANGTNIFDTALWRSVLVLSALGFILKEIILNSFSLRSQRWFGLRDKRSANISATMHAFYKGSASHLIKTSPPVTVMLQQIGKRHKTKKQTDIYGIKRSPNWSSCGVLGGWGHTQAGKMGKTRTGWAPHHPAAGPINVSQKPRASSQLDTSLCWALWSRARLTIAEKTRATMFTGYAGQKQVKMVNRR